MLSELRELPKSKLHDFTYMVSKEKKVLLSSQKLHLIINKNSDTT